MKTLLLFTALCFVSPLHAREKVIDAGDFETLQLAADAVPKSGGLLHIPAGTYELTEPLRITTGDTRIEGVGSATHIVNNNTDGQPAILVENPAFTGTATPNKDRLWRINFANLRITGNKDSGAGIEARYIEEIFVDGVTSSENGADGLRLGQLLRRPSDHEQPVHLQQKMWSLPERLSRHHRVGQSVRRKRRWTAVPGQLQPDNDGQQP